MKTIDLIQGLVSTGALNPKRIQGCGPKEMDALQQHFGCALPEEYAAFMQLGGCGVGNLFVGTDIYYPRVLGLKAEAEELMTEDGVRDLLAANAIVFCLHQGYEVNYMLPGSRDPAVWQYIEGSSKCVLGHSAFSLFIQEAIQSHLEEIGTCD